MISNTFYFHHSLYENEYLKTKISCVFVWEKISQNNTKYALNICHILQNIYSTYKIQNILIIKPGNDTKLITYTKRTGV